MTPEVLERSTADHDRHTQCVVLASTYRDSIVLMDLSHGLEAFPGVHQVAVMMATPHNKIFLQDAGLLSAAGAQAGPNDLLVCVQASTASDAANACQHALERLHTQQAHTRLGEGKGSSTAPRTLEMALRAMPDANLACISVPGPYAAYEARKAVRHGLHVFLFSDHVDVQAEVALKRFAAQQGVLVMGPDCGTAMINGVPLGFANQVPRGPVGIIAASGTGLQQVSCLLAQQGIGITQALGVGGRDGTEALAGASMRSALQALAQDQAAQVIVLVTKPPAATVTARLLAEARQLGKPCVLALIGATIQHDVAAPLYLAPTLADAARMAAALVRGEPLPVTIPALPAELMEQLPGIRASLHSSQTALYGLYCGGTLAQEALWLLRHGLGQVVSNLDHSWEARRPPGHTVLDLGAEEFTSGRPHPMIDPSTRRQHLLALAQQPEVAVVLCDVMLGWGAHADPAMALATAWQEASHIAHQAGRTLVGIATVCGTSDDPQGLDRQRHLLREHGFVLADSNAQAVRFAAAVIAGTVLPSVRPEGTAALPPGAATSALTLPTVQLPARLPALLAAGPRVINLGVERFATPLLAHGVPVVQVDWRPPAAGDLRLLSLLERVI